MSAQATYPNLFKIDAQIEKILKGVELLPYLNPINAETEKRKFFQSKYTKDPKFAYTKIKFNAFNTQRRLFAIELDRIEEIEIRKFYEEVIYFYSSQVDAINHIGNNNKFYYNSLKLFGTPKDKDVENAKFILHFEDDELTENAIKKYTANDAQMFFEDFSKNYDFKFTVEQSVKIASEAMVKNRSKVLLLKKNALFSQNKLNILAHHEIGVHLLTSYNAQAQNLHIFSNGFPRNVETQEGLAVFSEFMSGSLSIKRLKTLAYRVIAVDSLRKGYNFVNTFDLLHNTHKLNIEDAFIISMRVHRGGGFTKDYLYLTGLKKVYDYYHSGKELNVLLTGKVNLEHQSVIEKLLNLGLAKEAAYFNHAFLKNNNTNNTLDFILKNLK
ncbi:flavohemoglobin expression-modulating QEGLA motif protein [Ascidiimonas sp. W6]|uniref:flavohemoglobin expression-modulating QEGLA motif protein n=1 Tax=Ascidiimonas meishanensis TaxID=3128903 RepID=UPI0030EEA261